MPNKKISELTAITSGYVPSTDVIPIVAGGVTKKTTLANLFTNGLGIVSVKNFGAVGDGVTDDTTAIQAAIDLLPSTGGVIYFPPGLYKVTAQLTITKDQVYFLGAGARASAIRVNHAGNAILVQHASSPGTSYVNAFGMSNISVRARVETTSGACLKLNKVQLVTISDVFLEDHFGGIEVLGGADHYITNLHIFSPRASAPVSWAAPKAGSFYYKIGRSSDGQIPTEIFISNFNWRRTENSDYIDNGLVVNSVDGLWLSNGHIMGVDNADMHIEPLAAGDQISGVKCSNVWFDNNADYGIYITGSTAAVFGELQLDGCNILTPRNTGIFVDASATAFEGLRITGGQLLKSASYGMLIRAGQRHIINGMHFGACNTNTSANVGAVTIDGGADSVSITGCTFEEEAYGVTATSMIGVRINSGATTDVLVSGCAFKLTGADISDVSTSDANAYPENITTKAATVTPSAGSLPLPEIGNQFYVAAGNFSNATGRWNDRTVRLVFAGASTVTHNVGGIRLAGSANLVAKAGDTLTLLYSPDLADWVECGRMIS